MKWLSHGWATFTELVSVAIAFAVINTFSSQFERIVIDLLVLIYVAARSGIQTTGWIALEQGRVDRNRFLELLKSVGNSTYETQEQKETMREEADKLDRVMMKGFIHAGGMFVMSAMAILNLIFAL